MKIEKQNKTHIRKTANRKYDIVRGASTAKYPTRTYK
jgi:hypothetical protein